MALADARGLTPEQRGEMLVDALAEIRNRTILWRRGTETELLREIHALAQRALDDAANDVSA